MNKNWVVCVCRSVQEVGDVIDGEIENEVFGPFTETEADDLAAELTEIFDEAVEGRVAAAHRISPLSRTKIVRRYRTETADRNREED